MHRFELGACDRQTERQADEQIAACAEHKNYSLKRLLSDKKTRNLYCNLWSKCKVKRAFFNVLSTI